MEKTLPMIFIAFLCFAGISYAQNDLSTGEVNAEGEVIEVDEPGELDKIDQLEQNVSNMLKLLEDLEKGEGLKEKLKAVDRKKKELPDPMDQFVKPEKKPDKTVTSSQKRNSRKSKGKQNIETSNEVVKLPPEGPGSHFRLALDFWRARKLDKAIQHFKEVVRRDHENAHAYWNLGLIYEEKKDHLQAMENIKKAETIYLKYDYTLYAQQARKRLEKLSREKNAPSESSLLSN
ncbi:MAG: hypothetical protein NPINA01_00110 [Nitrospinaceae bacterium]|nr:MAG: hypothetical protein NPINA01_00110 [Nitrospinaceae bacterium]